MLPVAATFIAGRNRYPGKERLGAYRGGHFTMIGLGLTSEMCKFGIVQLQVRADGYTARCLNMRVPLL